MNNLAFILVVFFLTGVYMGLAIGWYLGSDWWLDD